MTALIPTDLVHPHVYDHNVCHCQTEQRDLFLYDFFLCLTLNRVEPFSVDYIQVIHVLKPYPFRAAFSILFCVQNWKTGSKGIVHQRTFPRALRTKNRYGCIRVWELPQLLTTKMSKKDYFKVASSLMMLIILLLFEFS